MRQLPDSEPEGNSHEPWAFRRTWFLMLNGLREFRGEPPMPEPNWPIWWREQLRAAAEAAASYGHPQRQEQPTAAAAPAGLNRREASSYVGVSPNHFDKMVRDGSMPKPIPVGRRKIWHRASLDAVLSGTPALVPEIADETWS